MCGSMDPETISGLAPMVSLLSGNDRLWLSIIRTVG